MPQDTAARSLVALDVPPLDATELAKMLGAFEARLDALDRRLRESDDRIENKFASVTCNINDTARETARLCDANAAENARLREILTGRDGLNGYCSRVRRLEEKIERGEDILEGLVKERRQAQAAAPKWYHRALTSLVVAGVLGLVGALGWLIRVAWPVLVAGP